MSGKLPQNVRHEANTLQIMPAKHHTNRLNIPCIAKPRRNPMRHCRNHFLILLLLASAFFTRFLNAGTLGDLTYQLNGDSVTITEISYWASGEVVIPSLIEGKPVITIGDRACYSRNGVSSVVLPSSVRRIGKGAFSMCFALTLCQIAEGVQEIDDRAFENCQNLKTLSLPSTVTHIGAFAFYYCRRIEKIKIPSGVTTIGSGLFYGCSHLRECVIPDQVTSIGEGAFANSGLEYVTIPSKVKSLAKSPFWGCKDLRRVALPDGMTEIGDSAFGYSGLEQVTIPSSMKFLGRSVFENCNNLRRVKLPDGMTEIGDYAFFDCDALKRIDLPVGLKRIGEYAFAGTSLSDLRMDGVKTIGANAFTGCNQLAAVRIPRSVKNIGDHAFFGCARLAGASFDGDAPQMGERVFGQNIGPAITDFTIFVEDDSTGFSIPRWLGYRLSLPSGEIAIHGLQYPYLLRNVLSAFKYGTVPVGDKTIAHAFKLTNVGNRPLTSIRAKLKGDDTSDFIVVLPPKTTLAPGKSTTVEIAFSPKVKGKRRTMLELESSDSNEDGYEIRLSGIGIKFF